MLRGGRRKEKTKEASDVEEGADENERRESGLWRDGRREERREKKGARTKVQTRVKDKRRGET